MTKDEDLKENNKILKQVGGFLSTLNKTIGLATAGGLTGVIGKTIGGTHDLIKATGDLGMSVTDARVHFRGVVTGLSEVSSEFATLGMALTLQRAGIDGNSKNILGLMNQERLLTGGHEKVAEAMIHLRRTAGFTTAGLEEVAAVVMEETSSRAVSTDAILQGMKSLGDSLKRASLLNQQKPLVEAMTILTAKYPGMEKLFSESIDSLTDGSSKGFMHVMMANAQVERSILANSQSGREIAGAVESSVLKFAKASNDTMANLGGVTDKFILAQNVLAPILGEGIASQVQLANVIGETNKSEMSLTAKRILASQTLGQAWEKFIGAVQDKLIPLALKIIDTLSGVLEDKDFIDAVSNLAKGLTHAALWLVQFGSLIVTTLSKLEGLLGVAAGAGMGFAVGGLPGAIAGGILGGITSALGIWGADEPLAKDAASTAKNTAKLVHIEEAREARTRDNLGDLQSVMMAGFSDRFRNSDTKRTNSLIQTLIDLNLDLVRLGHRGTNRGVGR